MAAENEVMAGITAVVTRGPKVAVPEYFYGDRSKLRTFLLQCELYFRFGITKKDDDDDEDNEEVDEL